MRQALACRRESAEETSHALSLSSCRVAMDGRISRTVRKTAA
jgi:hypothetical protein